MFEHGKYLLFITGSSVDPLSGKVTEQNLQMQDSGINSSITNNSCSRSLYFLLFLGNCSLHPSFSYCVALPHFSTQWVSHTREFPDSLVSVGHWSALMFYSLCHVHWPQNRFLCQTPQPFCVDVWRQSGRKQLVPSANQYNQSSTQQCSKSSCSLCPFKMRCGSVEVNVSVSPLQGTFLPSYQLLCDIVGGAPIGISCLYQTKV